MSDSIDALDLPLQMFALGTVLGMTVALAYFALTGELERWPVYVSLPSVLLFYAGLSQTIV